MKPNPFGQTPFRGGRFPSAKRLAIGVHASSDPIWRRRDKTQQQLTPPASQIECALLAWQRDPTQQIRSTGVAKRGVEQKPGVGKSRDRGVAERHSGDLSRSAGSGADESLDEHPADVLGSAETSVLP